MKTFEILLLLLISTAVFVRAHEDENIDVMDNEEEDEGEIFYPIESGVITSADFASLIANSEYCFVEFFAPWCGHCQQIKPEVIRLAELMKDVLPIIAIDATREEELARDFEIQGFPTFKFFHNGQPIDYDGGRSADDMAEFINKRMGPSVVGIDSVEKLADIRKGDVVVYLYAAENDDEVLPIFSEVAASLRDDVSFGFITDKDIAKKLGMIVQPSIKLVGFDNTEDLYDMSKLTKDDLEDFISMRMLPLFGEISPENFHKYLARNLPLVWVFLGGDEEINAPFIENARKIAPEFLNKVLFVYLSGVEHEEHAQFYGLSADFPAAVLVDDSKMTKFPFQEDGKNKPINDLKQFVEDCLAGKIESFIRSELIPEKNDLPVLKVVRSQFEELVQKTDDDVLLLVYAPWCPHCKAIHPIFEELATMMKSISGLCIANIDGTLNDLPVEYELEGFPTIYLLKKGEKDTPILFDSEARTIDGFVDFLIEKSSVGEKIQAASKYQSLLSFIGQLDGVKDQIKELIETISEQTDEIAKLKAQLPEVVEPELVVESNVKDEL